MDFYFAHEEDTNSEGQGWDAMVWTCPSARVLRGGTFKCIGSKGLCCHECFQGIAMRVGLL